MDIPWVSVNVFYDVPWYEPRYLLWCAANYHRVDSNYVIRKIPWVSANVFYDVPWDAPRCLVWCVANYHRVGRL